MNIRSIPSFLLIAAFMALASCAPHDGGAPVEWSLQGNGIWKITAGRPDKVNLLSELDAAPVWQAIGQIEPSPLPFDSSEIKITVADGRTCVRFPLQKDEKIFGLGLNFRTVEQQGRVMRLHVDHYGGSDNGRTHAPVPFFISDRGYGALINAARYIDVWAGTGVRADSPSHPVARDRNTDPEWSAAPFSDNLELLVPAEGVEIIIFSGKTMLDVVRRYNLYAGGGCLPPRWGLGFWHRTPSLFSGTDVLDLAREYRRNGYPLGVIGLEPGWMSRSYPCTYEWDSSRFPDPKKFLSELDSMNIKANLWINPYVSPDGALYDSIRPYSGSHTVWCGLVPDYTMPQTHERVAAHFRRHHLDCGVSGYKIDENDGYDSWLWPDVATFPSGVAAEQMRQIYGTLMQSATARIFESANLRTYGLVRASNAGASPLPYVLYNDCYNHKDFVTAMVNSSFIGVLWTPEVRSAASADEWLRRMQTVCFSPLAMLNGWADGTAPWSFADVAADVADILWLRVRLMPYLYTAFADYAFKGIPPVRAMNLEEGFAGAASFGAAWLDATENPYALAVKKEMRDQFMFGESMLVAPLFAGEKTRKVTLPAGAWYDFYTGEYAGAGEVIEVTPPDRRIPLFVRDGGIIPMYSDSHPRPEAGTRLPLEVRHYGNAPASYALYDDDGLTYDYRGGAFSRIVLDVAVDSAGVRSGSALIAPGAPLWSYSVFTFRLMTEKH